MMEYLLNCKYVSKELFLKFHRDNFSCAGTEMSMCHSVANLPVRQMKGTAKKECAIW